MLIKEEKLRALIREAIIDSEDINAFIETAKEYIENISGDIIAISKLNPFISAAFDIKELSEQIYEIASSGIDPEEAMTMSKEELEKAREDHLRDIKELIAKKIAEFVVDQVIGNQIEKIDVVLELVFDTNTEELTDIALSPEFREALTAILGKIFEYLYKSIEDKSNIIENIISEIEQLVLKILATDLAKWIEGGGRSTYIQRAGA